MASFFIGISQGTAFPMFVIDSHGDHAGGRLRGPSADSGTCRFPRATTRCGPPSPATRRAGGTRTCPGSRSSRSTPSVRNADRAARRRDGAVADLRRRQLAGRLSPVSRAVASGEEHPTAATEPTRRPRRVPAARAHSMRRSAGRAAEDRHHQPHPGLERAAQVPAGPGPPVALVQQRAALAVGERLAEDRRRIRPRARLATTAPGAIGEAEPLELQAASTGRCPRRAEGPRRSRPRSSKADLRTARLAPSPAGRKPSWRMAAGTGRRRGDAVERPEVERAGHHVGVAQRLEAQAASQPAMTTSSASQKARNSPLAASTPALRAAGAPCRPRRRRPGSRRASPTQSRANSPAPVARSRCRRSRPPTVRRSSGRPGRGTAPRATACRCGPGGRR